MWSNSTSSSDPVEVKLKGLREHLHFYIQKPEDRNPRHNSKSSLGIHPIHSNLIINVYSCL